MDRNVGEGLNTELAAAYASVEADKTENPTVDEYLVTGVSEVVKMS